MTTLHAVFERVAQRAPKARDRGAIRELARTVLGIAVLATLLAAGFALRALMYVRLP